MQRNNTDVYGCVRMCTDVYGCVRMCTDVYGCVRMCTDVYGCVRMRNCVGQLLESLEAWSQITEEGGCIDIIYTDFSKAFDSVSHIRLL